MQDNKQISPAAQKRVHEMLHRTYNTGQSNDSDHHSDDDDNNTEQVEQVVRDLEMVAIAADQGTASIEQLPPEQRKQFLRAVASGQLSNQIETWTAWWDPPSASFVPETLRTVPAATAAAAAWKSSNHITAPMKPSMAVLPTVPDSKTSTSSLWFASDTYLDPIRLKLIPLPHALQPLSALTQKQPSPLLPFSIVDTLYAYAYTLRFFNGDLTADPHDALGTMLTVSPTLASGTVHQSLLECIESVLQQATLQMQSSNPPEFALMVVRDVAQMLYFKGSVIRAMWHFHNFVQHCDTASSKTRKVRDDADSTASPGRSGAASVSRVLSADNSNDTCVSAVSVTPGRVSRKRKKSVLTSKERQMARKLYFFTVYCASVPEATWQALGDQVSKIFMKRIK
jgi:hypothetical protein